MACFSGSALSVCHWGSKCHELKNIIKPIFFYMSESHLFPDIQPFYCLPLSAFPPVTRSPKCRSTATTTGSSSATIWSWSITPDPAWHHPSSSSPTSTSSSRDTSAWSPLSRSNTLVRDWGRETNDQIIHFKYWTSSVLEVYFPCPSRVFFSFSLLPIFFVLPSFPLLYPFFSSGYPWQAGQ